MKRIYHYTSVESLALILKTRNLRFSRLDGVDDVGEAQTHAGIDFGKFFFVSCWTQQAEESIPQWSMYSNEMQGVRLELPDYPFPREPLRPKVGWTNFQEQGEILSPIPFETLCGPSYFIVPLFLKPDFFAGPVNYVSNVTDVYVRSIRREVDLNRNVNLHIEALHLLPRQKSIDWEFQKEYRFSLYVMPLPPDPQAEPGSESHFLAATQNISNCFINNIGPDITHIDIPLSPIAFKDLVVRTGPLATPGAKACVEALVAKFAPDARIEPSALTGTVRHRGRWVSL